MSLSLTKDDLSSKFDLLTRQLKIMEETTKKAAANNDKLNERINELTIMVKEQRAENNELKKSVREMKKDYDISKMDDKIISNYRSNEIKNWRREDSGY